MSASPNERERLAPVSIETDAGLFAWRGGGIVLLGEQDADRWVVVRGWLGPDTLNHVRRWSFASPHAFAGQIRRLALEATGDRREAARVANAAAGWTAALV